MNPQEYLSEAFRIISENFRSNDPTGGMTAASAAYLVKRLAGDHTEFGYPKFKDVLAALESEGRLRTGTNSKNAYSLWLIENSERPIQTNPQADRFRPLRNHIWFAFVASDPPGKRYIHRESGETRVGCSESPGESWVEIRPISPNQERNNARSFLEDSGIDDTEFGTSIEAERWYVEFPQALAAKFPHLAFAWKRERSSRVIDYVKQWCNECEVDKELVFEDLLSFKSPATSRLSVTSRSTSETTQNLREILLDAIQRMPTDELLRISIPASHLISVLRPDLLR